MATVVLVGVAFVAGFPLHTYIQQRASLSQASQQARQLASQNRSLENQVSQLQSDAAVEQLARSEYGLVRPGEEAYVILPQAPRPPGAEMSVATRQEGRSRKPSPGGSQPGGAATSAASTPSQPSFVKRLLSEFSF